MHRIDTAGHVDGLFQDGAPQAGQQGTVLDADWANAVQENIVQVILGAEIALEKGDHEQLKDAIVAMIAAAASANRVRPGTVSHHAGAAAPAGWLECDGAVVAQADYPDLFGVIGATFNTGGEAGGQFRLPDLRGEFIRGWDHGRGVDAGRLRGSSQADELKSHVHQVTPPASTDDTASGSTSTGTGGAETITPYNTAATGGAETRPRNVALMAIIKT